MKEFVVLSFEESHRSVYIASQALYAISTANNYIYHIYLFIAITVKSLMHLQKVIKWFLQVFKSGFLEHLGFNFS